MRYLMAAFCGFLAVSAALPQPANAEWTYGDSIIQDVKDVKDQVTGTGPIKQVADDFKDQLDEMVAKGQLLRENAADILAWLKEREGPYAQFIGSPKCGIGTPCDNLRTDLVNFFGDIGALRDKFPIIEKLGIGDGSRAIQIVEAAPAIVLFAVDRAMGRVPDWQSLPQELQALFDEVGDPEVFQLKSLIPASTSDIVAQAASVSAASTQSETPTQRFCRKRAERVENERDPVRMNRWKTVVFSLRQVLGVFQAGLNHTIGATIVGEGTETVAPNPVTISLQIVTVVWDVIERSVETFQANVEICRSRNREIEMQVAQCIPMVSVVMPGSRDDIYDLVRIRIDSAFEAGLFTDLSEFWMGTADNQRTAGEFRDAFESLCNAYQTIGTACNGSCQPNNGGGGRKNP